jgi:hypothetical protein
MRLWDPSDVSCLATVTTERKETVKVHSIVAEQMSEEEDDIDDDESGTTLLSDLGMDNHSAMSLMAGLLHPSLAGAWQYLIDQSDSTMGLFDLGSEVAIHCRSSSRKVSVDPTSLENYLPARETHQEPGHSRRCSGHLRPGGLLHFLSSTRPTSEKFQGRRRLRPLLCQRTFEWPKSTRTGRRR